MCHKQTCTSKAVAGCEIQAGVYRPCGDVSRPVILWLHGGGLIIGTVAHSHSPRPSSWRGTSMQATLSQPLTIDWPGG